MDNIVLSVDLLVDRDRFIKLRPYVCIISQDSVPLFVLSVYSGSYLIFVERKSFLSLGFWHWSVDYWLVRVSHIMFRWFLSNFHLFQIFMTWVWLKFMGILRSWLKAESFEVIEVWFRDSLQSHHKISSSWLFFWQFLRKMI